MRRINVAITGFGGIGRKVAQLLLERKSQYKDRFDFDVRITGVCGSSAGIVDGEGLSLTSLENRVAYVPGLTGDAFMTKLQADVLFEASPTDFRTGGASLQYMRTAQNQQMHIIAISKGALAFDYAGLHAEATRRKLALKLSCAAGSAMPTIDLVQYNLAGGRVLSIAAIVTGTTNFILSEMMDKSCSFADALAEAQRLGIAESDPTLDTHGWDTACKIAILCNAAFGTSIDVQQMSRQGIDRVTLQDVQRWRSESVFPRLVGRITEAAGSYQASVDLELFRMDHPFASAHGRTKAVHIVTDLMGELTLVGGGSSPYGTAATALKDFEHVLAALQQRVV